jgi:hypothetical protein
VWGKQQDPAEDQLRLLPGLIVPAFINERLQILALKPAARVSNSEAFLSSECYGNPNIEFPFALLQSHRIRKNQMLTFGERLGVTISFAWLVVFAIVMIVAIAVAGFIAYAAYQSSGTLAAVIAFGIIVGVVWILLFLASLVVRLVIWLVSGN